MERLGYLIPLHNEIIKTILFPVSLSAYFVIESVKLILKIHIHRLRLGS